MREILFRGKSLKDNEWTEGYYCRYGWTGKEKNYIIPDYASALWGVEVDSNTIGQFTGLTDKNGVKIFEGDIVRLGGANFPVIFNTLGECAEFALTDGVPFGFDYIHVPMEVVGNIYDNPELIGGEVNE